MKLAVDSGVPTLLIGIVATVLTVYGIETASYFASCGQRFKIVATVLTVYGIETGNTEKLFTCFMDVATVLTVYGIET